MRFPALFLSAILLTLSAGCSSVYYSALEKVGYAKREVLVDRVADTQKAQTAAKEQFESALQHFLAVTKADVGDLQRKYDEMNREFTRSESRAKEVRDRIASVEDVATALFNEWKQELKQYSNASLRAESERQLEATRRRYDDLVRLMRRAADRMEPVLATFRDQVLFLKHNLNARAIASLDTTNRELQGDISRLIADMEASIRECQTFIQTLKTTA
jgi:Skp family chaperone for outer membrane proteins